MSVLDRVTSRRRKLPTVPVIGSEQKGKHHVLDGVKTVTSPEDLEHLAKANGARAGEIAHTQSEYSQTLEEMPGRVDLSERVDARISEIRQIAQGHERDLDGAIASTKEFLEPELKQEREAEEEVAEIKKLLADAPTKPGISTFGYVSALVLLGLAEFPSISAAVVTWPFNATVRLLIAIIFSLVFAVAAHVMATRIRAIIDALGQKIRNRAELIELIVTTALLTGGLVFLIAFLALSRGSSFATISELTGGTFDEPELASGALLGVQLVLFLVALIFGLQHAIGDTRRRLERRLRKAQNRLEEKQEQVAVISARIRQLEEELANLPDETAHWIGIEERRKGSLLNTFREAFEHERAATSGVHGPINSDGGASTGSPDA